MPGSVAFQNQREFRCDHCSGRILVPRDMPPMTGPCPHCNSTITSPGPEDDEPPVQQVSAKVEIPAVVVTQTVEVPAPVQEEPVKPVAVPPPLPPSARQAPIVPAVEIPLIPQDKPPTPAEPAVEQPLLKEEPPAEPVKLEQPEPTVAISSPLIPPAEPPREPVSGYQQSLPAAVEVPVGPSPSRSIFSSKVPRQPAPPASAEPPGIPQEQPHPAPAPPPQKPLPAPEKFPEEPFISPPPAPVPVPEEVITHPAPIPVVQPVPASPGQVIPVAPATVPATLPVVPPLEPVKPADPEPLPARIPPAENLFPVERAPSPAPMPVNPVKISIGLSDEALQGIRPPPPVAPVEPVPQQAPPVPVVAVETPEIPPAPAEVKPAGKRGRGILVPLIVLLLLFVIGGAAVFYVTRKTGITGSPKATVNTAVQAKIRESQYSQTGWQDEARQVLSSFLAAETPSGKAAFSIRGAELLPHMNVYYGNGPIDDSDTPVSGFAAGKLTPEDYKRGIFRMIYEQPPQFEMREFFRPLVPLEIQFGIEDPDILLSSLARTSNFSTEPVRVELFFKRMPDGLKVDWETFIQTKYRTFRSFTELPDPGRSNIFRLFVAEDVPDRGRASQGTKTYRLTDPAHRADSVRVEVPVDSELGRSLSILNWRGVDGARAVTKTVTLELEWTKESIPRLAVKNFICWEFLGIGGQAVGGTAPAGGK